MKERLKTVFSDMFIIEPCDIHFDRSFKEYDIDSLDFVEFMLMVEDEFDVEVSDNDAEKMKTLGDILKYLENAKD
jgi:acyl carrier protein